MSGAGKSTALKMLEDMGYFCVDNLPVPLIPKFAELLAVPGTEMNKAALGVDIRSGQSFQELANVLKVLDEGGNDRNDDQGREYHAQGGNDASSDAGGPLAHKGSRIHRDDTRGTLSDGVVVHQLLLRSPAALFHDFSLEHREHGVAAAKGQAADAGKGKEEVKKFVHSNSPFLLKIRPSINITEKGKKSIYKSLSIP